jgi:hypothetical protein
MQDNKNLPLTALPARMYADSRSSFTTMFQNLILVLTKVKDFNGFWLGIPPAFLMCIISLEMKPDNLT